MVRPQVRSRPMAARARLIRPLLSTLAPLLAVAGLAGGGLLAPSAARADWVRTKDGLVLEGEVSRAADGTFTVTTEKGAVRLPASNVERVEAGDGPRALLRKD